MNFAIELHDSELASIVKTADLARIPLRPAYIHKSAGVPGLDPGTGWIQDIDLVIRGASIEGDVDKYPATITDGMLRIDRKQFDNCLPLPLNRVANVTLRLELMWLRGTITVRGSSISACLVTEPKYVEEFSGSL